MHYTKLASLMMLLLIQSQQSVPNDVAWRISAFFFIGVMLFLFVAVCVTCFTLFFGSFAVPTALGVQWLYGRSVLHWMNMPGGSESAPEVRPHDAPSPSHAPPSLRFELQDSDAPHGGDACPLRRRAERESRAVTRVHLIAGVAYAVAMTPLAVYVGLALRSTIPRPTSIGTSLIYLLTFGALLWLPVLTFVVMAVARPRRKLALTATYWVLLSSPLLFLPMEEGPPVNFLFVFMWLWLMTAPTSMMIVLRFSGVGGIALMMILLLAALAVAFAFRFFVLMTDSSTKQIWAKGTVVGPLIGYDITITIIESIFGGPLIAAIVAAVPLWWLSRRYVRKRTSEQLLLMDIFLLVTTFFVSLTSYLYGAAGWYTLIGPLPFALYELVVWAGLRRLKRRRAPARELRLLLLRVFGARRRSEWLMKRLGHYWRYSGSIQLIAAPDLAGANFELDELLDFTRGKLKERFIKDARDCAHRVESLDVLPDPDGRYRVNEFFCHDDVWQETVAALTRKSDAVLMDLRGFTPKNRGCVDEVHQLFDAVPVNRLVITVNSETDHIFLRQTFDSAWAAMGAGSPNRELTSPVLRLLNIRRQNSRAVNRLLSMLREAAESGAREAA